MEEVRKEIKYPMIRWCVEVRAIQGAHLHPGAVHAQPDEQRDQDEAERIEEYDEHTKALLVRSNHDGLPNQDQLEVSLQHHKVGGA